jgi:hypothetical protein
MWIGTNGRTNDTVEVDDEHVGGVAVAFLRLPGGAVTCTAGAPPALPPSAPAPAAVLLFASVRRTLVHFVDILQALPMDAVKLGGILMTAKGFWVNTELRRTGIGTLTAAGPGVRALYAVVMDYDVVEDVLRTRIPVGGAGYLGCFLISCYGRGQRLHGTRNYETNVFHQLYPGVPVLGMFSAGELGPDASGERPDELHQYSVTSIFCMLVYQRP